MTDDNSTEPDVSASTALLATAASGDPYKILGTISDIDGLGVVGSSTATTGAGKGVKGITKATGQNTDDKPAGVYGEAVREDTETGPDVKITYGVRGITRARGDTSGVPSPAGVIGEATGGGTDRGVTGITSSFDPEAAGVFGYADRFDDFAKARGVRGRTDSYDDGAAGVEGEATASSGRIYGVRGATASSNADTAGVYGATSGSGYGVHSDADAKVTGALEVTQTGASVYLDSNTVDIEDTNTLIPFDNATVDYGQWNPNGNYRWVPPAAGDYHVDAAVTFDDTPGEGTELAILLRQYTGTSGVLEAQTIDRVGWSGGGDYTVRLSKTLKNVGSGEGLYIQARQGTTSKYAAKSGDFRTYMTVTRVG